MFPEHPLGARKHIINIHLYRFPTILLGRYWERKTLPALAVHKGCHSHQGITLQPPRGNSGGKQDAHHLAAAAAATLR